jgi:leader peptidase (prepilin peptidase)/N-methyltransferase
VSSDLTFLTLAALLAGLVLGSFLNVVIHRLPKMMEADWRAQCAELGADPGRVTAAPERYDLVFPASHCPACSTPIRIRDNIPVLSYLLLRGQCATCNARISPRYPAVEMLTGALTAWVVFRFGWSVQTPLAMLLAWALIALAFIDADTTILPDSITLPLLWVGLLANTAGVFAPLKDAVMGAAAGYLILWSIYWAFKLLTKKEGMGYGDFKLLAALGGWFGWKMLLPIILLSSIVGAVVGIALIVLARRGRDIPIPFGPYLAAAGFIAMMYGQPIAERFGLL